MRFNLAVTSYLQMPAMMVGRAAEWKCEGFIRADYFGIS